MGSGSGGALAFGQGFWTGEAGIAFNKASSVYQRPNVNVSWVKMNSVDAPITFADYAPSDAAWVLALSAANEVETGFLDEVTLASMTDAAFIVRVANPDLGYLIAFAPNADYDSPNFKWFVARRTRFIYVDRIVVAQHARGRGIARRFYEDLFAKSAAAGYDEVTCEVNLDPPNPVSDKFHAALGFLPVGTATLPNGKTVTYLARALATS